MTSKHATALEQRHLDEWRKSAVSDHITLRNVRTITDADEVNITLGRSDGFKLIPGQLITSLEPATSQPTLTGCQCKADNPLPKLDKARRPIEGKWNKYLGRSNESPAPQFLDTGDSSFWPKTLTNSSREIEIVEGAKKSECLLTCELAAISIPGCFAWGKDGILHPLLAQFAVPGRPVTLWPDGDWRTNERVAAGWYKLGQALESKGCAVRVVIWPGEHKGIDDFAASGGDVLGVRNDAIVLSEWSAQLGLDEQLDITKTDVEAYIESSPGELNLGDILPLGLATPFEAIARAFNVPVDAVLLIFLTVCASLVQGKLLVSPLTRFSVPPIIWLAIIAESGGAKTPVLWVFMAAIYAMQSEYELKHQAAAEAWRQAKKDAPDDSPEPEPKPIDLFYSDATFEAICAGLKNRPRGIKFSDELAGHVKGQNQYRGGKGNDRQRELELWNGKAAKSSRKTERIFAEETSLSVLGGIQPTILRQLIGDVEVVDGFWQRFILVHLPMQELPPPGESGGIDIYNMLLGLYRSVDRIPRQDYRLSLEAQRRWDGWHREIERLRLTEPHPALRAVYPKLREYAGRIALVLHVVKSAFDGRIPPTEVSLPTLESGITVCRHLIPQTRGLYHSMGASVNPGAQRMAAFVKRFRGKTVTARDVTQWWPDRRQVPRASAARAWLRAITDIGLGEVVSEGRSLKVRITENLSTFQHFPRNPDPIGARGVEDGFNTSSTVSTLRGENVESVEETLKILSTPLAPSPSESQGTVEDVEGFSTFTAQPLDPSEVSVMLGILELSVDVADLDSFSRLPKHHKDQLWGEASPELQARLKEIRRGTAA